MLLLEQQLSCRLVVPAWELIKTCQDGVTASESLKSVSENISKVLAARKDPPQASLGRPELFSLCPPPSWLLQQPANMGGTH